MTMPNMTGDKLSKELKKIRPDIVIILCTGYNSAELKFEAKETGISTFMMEPLTMRNMAITVRKVLDEKNSKAGSKQT